MNAVVILFRNNARAIRAADRHAIVQPKQPARGVLTCIWRTNPASGRPECRWFLAQREATGERSSGPDLWRRQAA